MAYTQICKKERAEERTREGQRRRTGEGQSRGQNRDRGKKVHVQCTQYCMYM